MEFHAALADGAATAPRAALGRLAALGALVVAPGATTSAWAALVDAGDWYPDLVSWLRANRHALRVGIGHWDLDAATLADALGLDSLGRAERGQFVEWCAAAALPLRDAWRADGGSPKAVAERWFPSSASDWTEARARAGIRSWYPDRVVAAAWLLRSFPGPTAPSVVVRSRHDAATLDALARPTAAEITARWSAALERCASSTAHDDSFTLAQQATLLHPMWKELWSQSGWSLRRSRIDAAELWRRRALERSRVGLRIGSDGRLVATTGRDRIYDSKVN